MEVCAPNNVKIYNLSVGKSLPDWLASKKKKRKSKAPLESEKRIELIQEFEMPLVSDCVKVSNDGNYILATGTYKPRMRCYDVKNLSLKFERCLDWDVIQFEMLSDDYSKIVFLECDRFLEFHSQPGRYYHMRIPKCGRDMSYHKSSCDLYVVGASNEIYRLNLEQGRFLNPLVTDASALNVCKINPCHELFVCGTLEGRVEAWDPRSRNRVGILDCAFSSVTMETEVNGIPSVTSLCFKDAMTMAVGTATGQILLYDIRSNKPVLVKDHLYGLPIKDIEFNHEMDMVISMDAKVVKFWYQQTGKPFTSIQSPADLNDLCVVPGTGMLFLANEGVKLLTYYIPALGPAPKWCSFLDNLTEELEEDKNETVYEDYKFVTKNELEDLGLNHLIGSNLLRAYMHGYFLDIRLYHRAKAIADPFAFEEYRKKRIREKIEERRTNRVKLKQLPEVNKDLASKIMSQGERGSKKQKARAKVLLNDDRFKALFSNPEFEVDKNCQEFRLVTPAIFKNEKAMEQKLNKEELIGEQFEEMDNEKEGSESSEDESSSDDDRNWREELRKQQELIKYEARKKRNEEDATAVLTPKFYSLKVGQEFTGLQNVQKRRNTKLSLGERLEKEDSVGTMDQTLHTLGNREMTFKVYKSKGAELRREAMEQHRMERRKIGRSAKSVQGKLPPKFWMGKRVQ